MFKYWVWMAMALFSPLTCAFSQDQYSYRGFDAPVCVIQYGGYLYLSNAGKNPDMTAKDGDGYIARIKSDGSQEEATMKYLAGLDSPHGIAASKGILYVCDVDRLLGFNLQKKSKVFELSFAAEGTRRLSGLSFSDDNTLYVSATDINAIFEVHIDRNTYGKWIETQSPTGLLIDKNKMYVSSWGTDSLPNGKIGVIDMNRKIYETLPGCEGYLWGLALDGKKLYYCDWVAFDKRGVIKWHRLDNGDNGQIKLTEKMAGPAGFIFDARNNLFIVPAVLEGKVYGAFGFK
ncbi:MAG: hypothetical protein LBF89_06210 [Bacteroidales bacterium]|jgi:hypothetical protein|nr:hypothetical protein [Bacteroidales bacterium]